MTAAHRDSHTFQNESTVDAAFPDGDADLVAAAIIEPRAFARLYERYFDAVHAYCYRRIGQREDALDATSQVFINALQGLKRYRFDPGKPGSSFRSWLFAIAHNVVIDTYRRHRPATSLNRPVIVGGESRELDIRDHRPTPEDQAIASDTGARLRAALAELPERQRSIIELRLAGLSFAEISVVLNMSQAALRSAQFRGFSTLRILLTPDSHADSSREFSDETI